MSAPGPQKPPVREWDGDTHTLIVHSVRLPDGPLDEGDLDYDIEHPPSCTRRELVATWLDCPVQTMTEDAGLAFWLRYSGTPVTEPGTYKVRAWGTRHYAHEHGACEYDGGVVIVNDIDQASEPTIVAADKEKP